MVRLVQQQMEAKLVAMVKTSVVREKAKDVVVAANLATTMVNIIKLNKYNNYSFQFKVLTLLVLQLATHRQQPTNKEPNLHPRTTTKSQMRQF
jgi:hypothetical protein